MRLQCFLKSRSRSERGLRVGWQKSRWVRYILDQQQIQQMNCDNEDNGSMLFFKLKHLFFEQNLEQEQIASLVKDNPLSAIGKILVRTTSYYNQKVEQIVEALEDEKQHLVNQLLDVKQRLQHSLEDNEVFKAIIDRLEEINKDVQIRLNQSESEMERTNQECELIAGVNAKFKYEVQQLFQQNQALEAENSQLNHTIQQLEKEMETHKHSIQLLTKDYNNLFLSSREKEIQHGLLEEQLNQLKEENQNLGYKLHTKQQFIASFINEYNKIHFFQHHDPYNQTDKKLSDIRDRSHSHELKGFTFNVFEKESVFVEKKSKQDISVELEDIEIDSKFTNISATAQKPKNLASRAKLCESQQKSEENPLFKVQPKQFINPNSLKKSLGVKFERLFERQNDSGIMSDSVSLKNPILNNSNTFPSETEGSKIILQETLRKKISDKESRIKRLQSELYSIKTQYIEQRQKITQLQGEYEILVQQLRDESLKLKDQVSNFYQKYVLAHSQSQIYQEKCKELQEILQERQQEHAVYCRQLRDKCKEYVLKRIDQVEQYYKKIIHRPISSQNSPESENPVHEASESEQQQQEADDQSSRKSVSLKLESVQDRLEEDKNIQMSDTYSYRQLSSHHVNSLRLNLNFSAKNNMISSIAAVDEVYIKDTFEIESDLGAFTQRLKYEPVDHRQRGHLTARDHRTPVSQNEFNKNLKHLTHTSQIIDIQVTPSPKHLSLQSLQSIKIEPTVSSMPSINASKSATQKYLALQHKTVQFTNEIKRQRNLQITNCQPIACYSIQNALIKNSLGFKSKESNKKYSISSFYIFESASTLNTTFRQPQSEPKNHCDSFVINTDKNQEKNATFILQQQTSRSQVKISSFGLNSLQSEEKLNEKLQLQSSKKSSRQELESESFMVRSSSQWGLNNNQYIREDSCYEINPVFIQEIAENSSLIDNDVKSQVLSNLSIKKEMSDPAEQDSQQIQLKKSKEEADQVISSHLIVNRSLTSQKDPYPYLSKQPTLFELQSEHIQFNHQYRAATQDLDKVPPELLGVIPLNTSTLLSKFLKKHKLALTVDKTNQESTINYQELSKRKLILCQGSSCNKTKTFILTEKRLFCLEDETSIKADRVKYLPQNNLMMGQSQILLINDKQLSISRQSKFNKLKGDIPDGLWNLQLSVLCKYYVIS